MRWGRQRVEKQQSTDSESRESLNLVKRNEIFVSFIKYRQDSSFTKKPHEMDCLNIRECYGIDGIDDEKDFDGATEAMWAT